jgi:hypothetical protein
MAAPTIPGSGSQAVQTVQAGGTIPFVPQWWNFFNAFLTYVTSGPIGPVPLVGVTDGSSAAAGNVGEYISSIIPFGSGISLTTGTATQITSVTLSAGDWDLDGEMFFGFPNTRTTTFYVGWLAPTNSTTFPGTSVPGDGYDYGQILPGSGATGSTSTEPYTINGLHTRVNITSPTTYYLMGYINFSPAGSMTGYGAIRARRTR